GEIPAVGEGKFRLEHHAEFIGGFEVLLGRSPTVMTHIVETILAGHGEAAVEFALVRGRADRVRIDAVVAVAAQENRLAVEEKFSAGDLELAHAETDRTRVDHPTRFQQPDARGVKVRRLRLTELEFEEEGSDGSFLRDN